MKRKLDELMKHKVATSVGDGPWVKLIKVRFHLHFLMLAIKHRAHEL